MIGGEVIGCFHLTACWLTHLNTFNVVGSSGFCLRNHNQSQWVMQSPLRKAKGWHYRGSSLGSVKLQFQKLSNIHWVYTWGVTTLIFTPQKRAHWWKKCTCSSLSLFHSVFWSQLKASVKVCDESGTDCILQYIKKLKYMLYQLLSQRCHQNLLYHYN